MANERFTPGPWFKVGESRNLANNVSSHRIDAHDGQLCIAYVTDYTSKEACDANAALIAAAPAMYEALKTLADVVQELFDERKQNPNNKGNGVKAAFNNVAFKLRTAKAALAAANPETINT